MFQPGEEDDLKFVPSFGEFVADPPKEEIGVFAARICKLLIKRGFSDQAIIQAAKLGEAEYRQAKAGKLRKRTTYDKLTDGMVVLIQSEE